MNKVRMTSGTEGPRHDPYGFEEIRIQRPAGEVRLHSGLANWLELNGRKVAEHDEAQCWLEFERLVGVNPYVLKVSMQRHEGRRIERHLKGCRAHGRDCSGYPGESFLVCEKCGEVLDSHFDEGAVI